MPTIIHFLKNFAYFSLLEDSFLRSISSKISLSIFKWKRKFSTGKRDEKEGKMKGENGSALDVCDENGAWNSSKINCFSMAMCISICSIRLPLFVVFGLKQIGRGDGPVARVRASVSSDNRLVIARPKRNPAPLALCFISLRVADSNNKTAMPRAALWEAWISRWKRRLRCAAAPSSPVSYDKKE